MTQAGMVHCEQEGRQDLRKTRASARGTWTCQCAAGGVRRHRWVRIRGLDLVVATPCPGQNG